MLTEHALELVMHVPQVQKVLALTADDVVKHVRRLFLGFLGRGRGFLDLGVLVGGGGGFLILGIIGGGGFLVVGFGGHVCDGVGVCFVLGEGGID